MLGANGAWEIELVRLENNRNGKKVKSKKLVELELVGKKRKK